MENWRVATDWMQVTAEQIAQMYKASWQIEVFFRWIKQHLNVPTLFGTTENAVYGQLYTASWTLPVEWRLRISHLLQTYSQNMLSCVT